MGLYLCVFDDDEEVDGVEMGSYADFDTMRDYIIRHLEGGTLGCKFPTLILHSDCDGEWSVADCEKLRHELSEISAALKTHPPLSLGEGWQKEVAKSIGLMPANAFESLVDVDGEFLLDRLQSLVAKALSHGQPILFQ